MIPLWLTLTVTLVVAAIMVVYAIRYPLTNFLWMSNVGLAGIVLAMWLESAFLVSMMAVGLLLPAILWNISYFATLATGRGIGGYTDYMFDSSLPKWLRALSLYHVPQPFLLVWLVDRTGYVPEAIYAQTALLWTLYIVTRLAGPVDNVNLVYGFNRKRKSRLHPALYLALLMATALVCMLLPTHLALRHWFT